MSIRKYKRNIAHSLMEKQEMKNINQKIGGKTVKKENADSLFSLNWRKMVAEEKKDD